MPLNPHEGYRYVDPTSYLSVKMIVVVLCSASFCYHRLSSIEMHKSSIAEYEWPNGTYWKSASSISSAKP